MNLCAEIVPQDDIILYRYTTSDPLNMRDIYQCSIFISIARVKYLEGLHKLMNVCAIHSLCRHTNIKRTHFHLNCFFILQNSGVLFAEISENNRKRETERQPLLPLSYFNRCKTLSDC